MPDSFEHMPSIAIRMPNGGLTSLAGNVDSHHRVAVADLILVQGRVRETVTRLVRGEGDVTFRELLRAMENGGSVDAIQGLSVHNANGWVHNPVRAPHRLADGE